MLRIVKYLFGTLLVVVILAVAGVYGASSRALHRRYAMPTHAAFVAPTDSASIARGAHMASAIGKCGVCHGEDFGGKVFIDGGVPFGRFVAPNLTRGAGGLGSTLTDADWELAIRHGMLRGGRGLLFMPSDDFHGMSDADLGVLVAYMKQVPPVDRTLPATSVGPIARVLLVTGQLPIIAADRINGEADYPDGPAPAPTATYGHYLVQIGGCQGCHGVAFNGGHIPGTPASFKPAANLTPTGIGTWTEADFTKVLREGLAPGNVPVDSLMPWPHTKFMTDVEIDAVWAYLKTLPPKPMGH